MAVNTDKNKIEEVLSRGVEQVIVKEHLKKKMLAGGKLRVYYGIDPTSPQIHLGHSIVLRKLQAFAQLGHEVILLIGDFTARIGDPTDKEATRKPLTEKEIKENMKDYRKQASKILDFAQIKIKYNSTWLSKLKSEDWIHLTSKISVQRLLERDMFEKRLKQGKTISTHEFLYPLMQGYDSVAMDVDLEIAGTDQTFNMLVGRDLQKVYHNKEKDILTTKLLAGTDGRKMSKTFGNVIALTDKPNDMYGKIMSIQDELIGDYFELCTELPMVEIKEIKKQLEKKEVNPRDVKAKLAKEIVKIYHGEKAAEKAEKEFDKVFRSGGLPSEIQEFKTDKKTYPILDLLYDSGLAFSKAEAKRLVESKGVKINNKLKTDWQEHVEIRNGMVVQVGKRRFIRVIF